MITIDHAELADAPAIDALLAEIDVHYGDAGPSEDRTPQIRGLLFRPQPAARVLLARDASAAVGLAAYSFLWPAAGATSSLYLKELYVAKSHRGQGIGRQLMERLQDIARDAGCSRIEWTTDTDNPDAMAFYAKLGYSPKPTKIFYRLGI